MTQTDNFVFKSLHVIAWVIFIGLSIEASALIFNFIFSLYKPEALQNLYNKLDLSHMYNRSKWAFYGMYCFVLTIAILKAYLFYLLIKLLSKLNWSKPFTRLVSKQIMDISYDTFSIGIISYIARESAKNLLNRDFEISRLNDFWADSQAFILMGAVIYVIAIIFAKGIEIQEENDLTV
jgi:uncharacterized membrane protein YedE/YeeE